MEYTYTEVVNEAGELIAVNRSDGWWIPADPANSDYQRYLNPEAEQFTPIVTADE
jgi:hypothetical protein